MLGDSNRFSRDNDMYLLYSTKSEEEKTMRDYKSLSGPGDDYYPENSHVVLALYRCAGSNGKPYRESLHVNDMAEASLFVLDLPLVDYEANTQPMLSHINVGTGQDVTIAELAGLIAQVTGYSGNIVFDTSKPDGSPRKLMDVSRLKNMGWCAKIELQEGLEDAYRWYQTSIIQSV